MIIFFVFFLVYWASNKLKAIIQQIKKLYAKFGCNWLSGSETEVC